MAHITVHEGRVCIIKIQDSTTMRDGLEILKKTITEITDKSKSYPGLKTLLFIDLSKFTVINSNLIGVFGTLIMDQNIKLIGLCGIQHSVLDILKRFGVINEKNNRILSLESLGTNVDKVISFKTIDDGLLFLNP